MIKETITYTDYNGTERTEDYYFNLNKSELVEMEFGKQGGFVDYLDRIVKSQDNVEIVKVFKEIILMAYGEKSEDGRRFMKNQEIRDNFAQTEAYNILFMDIATDEAKAARFINGLVPSMDGPELAPNKNIE